MSASLRMAVLSLAVLGLSACAGMETKTASTDTRDPSIIDQDTDYISRVEEIARRRGVEVNWVNPPTMSERQIAHQPDR